ncbi:MAG: CehA/McbA family metallohydrolase, partial [Candidatus Omnitrophica bacterium]|nr:CehA/McbA family metallohydrolase [Candidatus Omnitrophota bacterium]
GFYIIAPSIVEPDEKFEIRFKILSEPYFVGSGCWIGIPNLKSPFNLSPRGIKYLDNVYSGNPGEIEVEIENKKIKYFDYHGVYKNDKRKFGTISDFVFESTGIKFIRIKHPETGIEGVSNPIIVKEKPDCKIYWGDLHSQTLFSDGLRCPEELYTFARDEAFLDFFCVSDHSEWITDRQWDYFCAVANDFNCDGRFVTLIAQEWTDHKAGHRNIYFPGKCGKILRAGINDINSVYETARKYGALVIPHHSANVNMGVDWRFAHDSELERLVEIYSVWGNSEMNAENGNTRPIRVSGGEKKGQHVIDALNMGYRFGFVGGGDIHDGRPGDELHNFQDSPADYKNLYRQGLTAIKTKNLTRKDLFEALYCRQCYATSNIRPILNFSINGVDSGGTITDSGKLYFSVSGVSEVLFEKLVIVSDGKEYRSFEIKDRHFDIEFESNYSGEKYFYARLKRADGELAWLSPIWIGE